jgi:four helix bundle protein
MVDGDRDPSARQRIERVEQMPVYELLYAAALRVERVARDWGPDFRWLRIQVLRSSESVCANLTEGFYAQYSTEYLQCLFRVRREGRETMTHLRYASDAGALACPVAAEVLESYENGMRQLNAVIAGIERKIQTCGKSRPAFGKVSEECAEYGLSGGPQPLTINPQPSILS